MKFKLLLSLITTLIYTNTFIASATELSDMKHSKSRFDENMQVNIEEKIISDLKDILLKNGGQEMLSKFINKYDLKCTTESFSKKLKVGARECQLENKESDDGVPLLMIGIENDKIIATVYSGKDITFLRKMKCSFSRNRLPICFSSYSSYKERKYWLKLWNKPLQVAN